MLWIPDKSSPPVGGAPRHFLSPRTDEVNHVLEKWEGGWRRRLEPVAFVYGIGTKAPPPFNGIPVWRLCWDAAQYRTYTTSNLQRLRLKDEGWRDEGLAFWLHGSSESIERVEYLDTPGGPSSVTRHWVYDRFYMVWPPYPPTKPLDLCYLGDEPIAVVRRGTAPPPPPLDGDYPFALLGYCPPMQKNEGIPLWLLQSGAPADAGCGHSKGSMWSPIDEPAKWLAGAASSIGDYYIEHYYGATLPDSGRIGDVVENPWTTALLTAVDEFDRPETPTREERDGDRDEHKRGYEVADSQPRRPIRRPG